MRQVKTTLEDETGERKLLQFPAAVQVCEARICPKNERLSGEAAGCSSSAFISLKVFAWVCLPANS